MVVRQAGDRRSVRVGVPFQKRDQSQLYLPLQVSLHLRVCACACVCVCVILKPKCSLNYLEAEEKSNISIEFRHKEQERERAIYAFSETNNKLNKIQNIKQDIPLTTSDQLRQLRSLNAHAINRCAKCFFSEHISVCQVFYSHYIYAYIYISISVYMPIITLSQNAQAKRINGPINKAFAQRNKQSG